VSGSLTLLTNLCLAWTATRMQEVIFGENGLATEEENLEGVVSRNRRNFR